MLVDRNGTAAARALSLVFFAPILQRNCPVSTNALDAAAEPPFTEPGAAWARPPSMVADDVRVEDAAEADAAPASLSVERVPSVATQMGGDDAFDAVLFQMGPAT